MAEKSSKSASQTVNFGYNLSISPSLELDEEYNKSYYRKKESKVIFDYTESAFLKVLPSKSLNIKYEESTSNGVVVIQDANVSEDFEENLTFANTNTAELKYPPDGTVTFTWKGKTSTSLSNSGQTVTASVNTVFSETEEITTSKPLGTAICKYKILYDRLKLSWNGAVPEDNTQVVVIVEYNNTDKSSASCEIQFTNFGFRDVELIIRNIATDKGVSDATVIVTNSIDEMDTQTVESVEGGRALFTNLKVGQEYKISVTHTDYIATELDYLNNNFFTVPEVEEETT